jgi:predicted RNase H-like nuclease (RuvC/YqgF family)
LVITTEAEKARVNYPKVLVFHDESDLEPLILEVKKALLGKEVCDKIVIGIDPGVAIGLAVLADGKMIEEGNFFSSH